MDKIISVVFTVSFGNCT